MKPGAPNQLLAASAAVIVALGLGACKTITTTGKMRQVSTGNTEWERNLGDVVKRSAREISDPDVDYTHSQFDQKSLKAKTSSYDKKSTGEKSFRTKEFQGPGEYKSGEYHFLKRQEFNAKTSPDQDQVYSKATTESPDQKKKFFWQNKRASSKPFRDSDKIMPTGEYGDTKRNLESLEGRDLNIVDDPAKEAGATLTIDDVREMLGGGQ